MTNKPTFEDSYKLLENLIETKRNRWLLTSINWMDFDDAKTMILYHIYLKWDQYNPEFPLQAWAGTIVNNKLTNIYRDLYCNYKKVCISCPASEGTSDSCRIYGEQDSAKCKILKKWEGLKKSKHNVKLTLPLENHSQEVYDISHNDFNLDKTINVFHVKMKTLLKPIEYKVYEMIYINGKTEEEAAKLMGYKTKEKYRSPGYRQIKNIIKKIIEVGKELSYSGDIDFIQ